MAGISLLISIPVYGHWLSHGNAMDLWWFFCRDQWEPTKVNAHVATIIVQSETIAISICQNPSSSMGQRFVWKSHWPDSTNAFFLKRFEASVSKILFVFSVFSLNTNLIHAHYCSSISACEWESRLWNTMIVGKYWNNVGRDKVCFDIALSSVVQFATSIHLIHWSIVWVKIEYTILIYMGVSENR